MIQNLYLSIQSIKFIICIGLLQQRQNKFTIDQYFYYYDMHETQSRISQSNTKIEKLIEIDDPNIQNSIKGRIRQKLLQDAEFLLEKKKKQQQKIERVKRIQLDLQKQRQERLQSIVSKKNKSEHLMDKNKQTINKKIKQKQEYFKQILNRVEQKQKQQIRNALTKQKQLSAEIAKSMVKMSRMPSNQTFHSTINHSRYIDDSHSDELLEKIEVKIKKASEKHDEFKKKVTDRLRHKFETIANVQQKALSISCEQQSEAVKNWTKKTEFIGNAHETIKSQRQKKLTKKKQTIKYKIQKCNENLKNLSYREEERRQQLKVKFDKKFQPKEWKDNRLEKYWRLWQQNLRRIQQQKMEDGDKILNKHQQITDQNKIYKQKKEKLMQVLKSM